MLIQSNIRPRQVFESDDITSMVTLQTIDWRLRNVKTDPSPQLTVNWD